LLQRRGRYEVLFGIIVLSEDYEEHLPEATPEDEVGRRHPQHARQILS